MRLVLLFLLFSSISFGQSSVDFLKTELDSTLWYYSQINYYGINKTPIEYGISIEEYSSSSFFSGAYTDTCETFEISEYLSNRIGLLFDSISNDSSFSSSNYKELAKYDLTLTYTSDKKIFSFQLPIKSGGTMRFTKRWCFFKKNNNTISKLNDLYFSESSIVVIDSIMYYILSRINKGCSTCYLINYDIIHFENNEAVVDFNYSLETRNYEAVYFDLSSKRLIVDYVADDLTGNCVEFKDGKCRYSYGFNAGKIELITE